MAKQDTNIHFGVDVYEQVRERAGERGATAWIEQACREALQGDLVISEVEVTRRTLRFDEELYAKIKAAAEEREVFIWKWIDAALRKRLATPPPAPRAPRPPRASTTKRPVTPRFKP